MNNGKFKHTNCTIFLHPTWIIYVGCLPKKSCQLPSNSRDVQETLPSNPNSPHNFSHIRTRGPIRSPSPCLRRRSKRGKYPYSPRGHAMKSCNSIFWQSWQWISFELMFKFISYIIYVNRYIQHFYILNKFSISVLCHGHQLSILYLYKAVWLTIAGPSRRHSGGDGQWHSQEEVVQGNCHVEVLNPRGQTLGFKHVKRVEKCGQLGMRIVLSN